MKSFNMKTLFAVAGLATLFVAGSALAHSNAREPKEDVTFSFEGPLGTFDQAQLQRGYKVYREVCSSCHSMKLMSYRNLGEVGGPFYDKKYKTANDNAIVKQIASEYDYTEIDRDTGDEVPRKGTPSDTFKSPFKNKEAAAASNGGAAPPDLSVIAKAREGGARYIYSVLTGFETPPAGLNVPTGRFYNPYVNGALATQWTGDKHHVPEGGILAMPPPLADGKVTFDDGTKSSLNQEAADVATFLEWAGDPHATERKKAGWAAMIYLFLFGLVTYGAYRQLWKGKH